MKHFNFNQLKHALLALLLSFIAGSAWSADVINNAATSEYLSGTGTTSWADDFTLTGASGAQILVHSMGTKDGNHAIQWNRNGYLYMKVSGGTLESISITGTSGKRVSLFASNEAYTGIPASGQISTITLTGEADKYTFKETYTYLALKGMDSSTQISEISITYKSGDVVTVDAPTFSPAAGEVESGTKVTLTQPSAAIIMYTTDGTEPSYASNNGQLYENPIEITKNTTIKAIAVDDDDNESAVATATYTLKQAGISGLSIDFESSPENYSDWTFANITQANKLTPKAGSYYGNTGGKTTASIQTKNKVATPGTFTCFLSKESTNTKANVWTVSVSADGENWTEVGKNDGSGITNTTWTKFSVDLSAYSDVYVKLSYEGTAAVRAVDEISISVSGETPAAPYTSIAALNADAVEGNTPVKVNMNGWKVVGVNGNQFYLTDGTAQGIVCYQKNHGFKLHDALSGTVECNLTLFNSLPEITELTTATEGLNVTADAPATPYEVASIASLSTANQGALVTLKNVKFDGSNFVDAAGKIQPNNKFKVSDYENPETNYYYDVTGVVIVFNGLLEIAPQEAAQFAPVETEVDVKVPEAGWATFVADADVTLPDGVTAYTVTGADTEGVLQLKEVKDVVTANTPVVLKADAAVNTTVQGHKAEKAERPTSGMLVGTYTDTDAPIPSYVLQKLDGVVAFYIVEQTMTVTAGHAFLITDEPTMGGVKAFTFDRATGIMMNEQTPSQTKSVIYDMSGRRVEKMTKGLYIVNGKKVLK